MILGKYEKKTNQTEKEFYKKIIVKKLYTFSPTKESLIILFCLTVK